MPVYSPSRSLDSWERYEELQKKLQETIVFDDDVNCTNDYPDLAKRTGHYLFVYGNEKEGMRKHESIEEFPCVGVGYTKNLFKVYKYTQGITKYPVMTFGNLSDNSKESNAHVYGEIYMVPPEFIANCDWNLSNEIITKRVRLNVTAVVDADGTERQLWPFTYIHRSNYWNTRTDHLSYMKQYKSNATGMVYYNYTKDIDSKD